MLRNALAVALMSSLVACSADGADPDERTSADAGSDDVETTVELEIDTPDASTYWSSVPVTGHGPASGTLIYTTSAGGQFTEELGASGDFCVDVILSSDTNNSIKFEAIDQRGTYSESVVVDVRQAGEPPDSETDPEPNPGYTNIAYGAAIEAMSVGIDDDGDVAALVFDRMNTQSIESV